MDAMRWARSEEFRGVIARMRRAAHSDREEPGRIPRNRIVDHLADRIVRVGATAKPAGEATSLQGRQ